MNKCWTRTDGGDYWCEFFADTDGVGKKAFIAMLEQDEHGDGETSWYVSVTCETDTDWPVYSEFALSLDSAEDFALGFIENELGVTL